MKKIIFLLTAIFAFSITNVKADTINSIDLDLYIDKDGNAEITEKWDVEADSGTSCRRQCDNLHCR